MSALTFPGARFDQIEPIDQTLTRIQNYLDAGGSARELELHIVDLTDSDEEPIDRISQILSYCLAASRCQKLERTRKLTQAYVRANISCQQLLIIEALKKCQYDLVTNLCEMGYKVTAVGGTTGASPLHILVQQGNEVAVEWLLKHGADVDQPIPDGRTALHLAAGEKMSAVVKLLLDHQANVNHPDSHLFTPLHYAASKENNGAILALLMAAKPSKSNAVKALAIAKEHCPSNVPFIPFNEKESLIDLSSRNS